MIPYRMALVNRIARNVYPLTFIRDKPIVRTFDVPEHADAVHLAFDHTFECEVIQVYYLPGVQVKAIAGSRGRLQVKVDGELLLEDELDTFTFPVNPARGFWKHGGVIFQAVELLGETKVSEKVRGFILPNGSRIEVLVDLQPGPAAELEVTIPGGVYKADGTPFQLPDIKVVEEVSQKGKA